MAASSTLPPVSEEQAFLETFFLSISKFAFDRAKETTEKQKESSRTHPSILWVSFLSQLLHLALTEKAYASFTYLSHQNLGQRLMGRRENPKSAYNQMRVEFLRMEESTQKLKRHEAQLEKLLGHLSGQLGHFVSARLKMMDFYEQIMTLAQRHVVNFEDQLVIVNDIIETSQKNFHHPILSPIKSSFSTECEVVKHLFLAQIALQNVQFLPCLIQLHDAHNKLTGWTNQAINRDTTKKLTFGSKPTPHSLCQWLHKFKGLLVSKFSLYFYEVLSRQGPPQEVKGFMMKTSVDFISKIAAFQKRADALCVALILQTSALSEPFTGIGYHHPQKYTEPLSGIDSYPAIFTHPPGEKPEKMWPSVVMFLMDHSQEETVSNHILYCWDERMQHTFFSVRVEQAISLVALFETCKSEKDSYINNTLNELSSLLLCTRLFASMRPGSK